MPNGPLLAVEALIMGFLELKRFQGWKETGTSGFLNAFPLTPRVRRRAAAAALLPRACLGMVPLAQPGPACTQPPAARVSPQPRPPPPPPPTHPPTLHPTRHLQA